VVWLGHLELAERTPWFDSVKERKKEEEDTPIGLQLRVDGVGCLPSDAGEYAKNGVFVC
jgi:hypothetical protein